MNYIKFINHASIIISNGKIGLLSDPWYSGSVFHEGWSLIHENEKNEILDILNEINYIWISHEHPDHFSVPFFVDSEIKNKINELKIKILFQKTIDRRVYQFFLKNKYEVIELNENQNFHLDTDFNIELFKSHFYDSGLILKIGKDRILNLNDCPLNTEKELNYFLKIYGEFDILLTQFSYAAWKGGEKNKNWRKDAADEKIDAVIKQCEILKIKKLIPFASYIYFSNVMNSYLNDSINTPKKISNALSNKNVDVITFKPLEKQYISDLKQDLKSEEFWSKKYSEIDSLPLNKYKDSFSLNELQESLVNYRKKIISNNSKLLILLISKIKILGIFAQIRIFLIDHNKVIKYSIFKDLEYMINQKEYDIKLYSSSLKFIFDNEFGFDTLTVNGCFESEGKSFSKVAKNFSIGSLNTLGIKFNIFLVFNLRIIMLFLKQSSRVGKKLKNQFAL